MTKSKCTDSFQWLGLQNYKDVATLQKKLVPKIAGRHEMIILGTEFFPVMTLGIRGKISEDLFLSEQELQSKGLEVVQTDRGGQATIHSPGQLIIYPMLDLKVHQISIREFVPKLMRVTISALREFGVEARYSSAEPGIYTSQGKLGFCGLKSDHGVMRHGLSININNDLSLFSGVRSCGHKKPPLDQVCRYHSIEAAPFFRHWCLHFQQDFHLSAQESVGMNEALKVPRDLSSVGRVLA